MILNGKMSGIIADRGKRAKCGGTHENGSERRETLKNDRKQEGMVADEVFPTEEGWIKDFCFQVLGAGEV